MPAFYFFFPETNGRHLEQIDEIFRKSKGIFDPVKIEKELPKQTALEQGTQSDMEKHPDAVIEHRES